jgi:hypothetical protein
MMRENLFRTLNLGDLYLVTKAKIASPEWTVSREKNPAHSSRTGTGEHMITILCFINIYSASLVSSTESSF